MDSIAVTAPSPESPDPLPRVPGPNLAPFTRTAFADIEFIEELGDPAVDMDSFVWKVRINGEEPYYALKMFRFNSHRHLKRTIGSTLNHPLKTPQLWIDYFDPFNCECRVYGRLREEHREDLAVRAYGYLLLTAEQEREVVRRSSSTDPGGSDTDNDTFGRSLEPLVRDRPVHAIVKTFVTSDSPFEPGQVEQLVDDMEALHRLGILVRDITISNYLGGKLIDFSRAWTAPHPSLERIYENQLEKQRWRDPYDLQNCIVDWGLQAGWEEVNLPKELLACILKESENYGCGTDPRRYDWRKWETDLAVVDAFMENDLYGPPYPPYEEWMWEEETV